MENTQLAQLVSRLETVTNRLETIILRDTAPKNNTEVYCEIVDEIIGENMVELPAGDSINHHTQVPPQVPNSHGSSASVKGFEAIINGKVAEYVALSEKIGKEVKEQADLVRVAFEEEKKLIIRAENEGKPANAQLMEYLSPISAAMMKVQGYAEANRANKENGDHLFTVKGVIDALAWVSMSPPVPAVQSGCDSGAFYWNKVLKNHKNVEAHVNWVNCLKAILSELTNYVKEHHKAGLAWKAAGSGAPPPPAPGGVPPPPPPVAAPTGAADPSTDTSQQARTAMLADLNKGSDVTKGLKKVTDDMKTHKNPELRASSTVPATTTVRKSSTSSGVVGPKPFCKTSAKPAFKPAAPKKAPVLICEGGKKWIVEHHDKNRGIVIEIQNNKQTVYIYDCKECVIQVKGKVNNVVLDSCKKSAVVIDDLIAGLEFVNCQSVETQINGDAPLVSIDKTDGIQVYLSQSFKNTEIVAAKSSSMNVLVPNEKGEFDEYPLPEQFKSVWNGKGFTTTATES